MKDKSKRDVKAKKKIKKKMKTQTKVRPPPPRKGVCLAVCLGQKEKNNNISKGTIRRERQYFPSVSVFAVDERKK
ncbi:Uncharacterized protein APZ42_005502 [Daphnia magna]|uniref:Uncharacterized protein n=1 Tax=Daphnia magna TaxID=35525 RepID=A0A164GET5_9CRUS|nr:Uncharacterized protein APZ42_005502 [Daphnia magna]